MFNSRFFRNSLLTLGLGLISFSCTYAVDYSSLFSSINDNYGWIIETSPDKYLNNLFTLLTVSTDPSNDNSGPRNLEGLIFSYCASVLVNNTSHVDSRSSFIFSPNQSSFVYLLCKNIHPNSSLFFTGKIENFAAYFKESDFAKLDLPVKNDQKYLAYLYVDDLFNSLIKEYFTIKQADVYGLQTDNETKSPIETQVNNFSASYFNGINICDKSQNLWKHFTKTCTYMTQYLRKQKRMFNDLNILSASGMHNDYASLAATTCSDLGKTNSSYNIILCGLRWDPTQKSLSPFINLVYNELFYYNLFVEYYGMQVKKNPTLFKDSTMEAWVWTIITQQTSRINEMKTELIFSKQALEISIRMLRNAYVTFPLHIWFLMYRESLQDFGQAIAKIATPVYTLFGMKFKGVQCLRQ